ncbi:DUF1642 domain-containing protein [Enterococcus thailandicus]|uniref:DUF1642 domain-containing protein n=1 Tax=Enterococcus thailandicus TaxID=417368 RepID=UPI0039A715C3
MNKQEAIKKLESIKVIGNDALAACYNESINAGITLMKKIDEPQKPVIPQLVAGWLEKSTDPFTKAEKIAYLIKSKDGDSYYFCDWFVRDGIVTQEQGEELLAWATRRSYETLLSLYNGYEVEKEPLYVMPIPHVSFSVHYCVEDDHISFRQGNAQKFTQAELDKYFPDIKQFAVKVEEVVEG